MASSHRDTPPADRLICVGVVTGARGLGGEVRIKSFTADPADVAAYGPLCDETGRASYRVRVTGTSRGQVVARFEGVEDRDGAEALKGCRLYVPRRALPEAEDEEYYQADLVGLRAELAGGGVVGTVRAVHDFGAGAVIEIEGAGTGNGPRQSLMVPFTRDAVPEIDRPAGRIVIDPPPGLMEQLAPDDGDAGDNDNDDGEDKERP